MRDGMHLIAVVMGSPTRDVRNDVAKKLLDYGFANFAVYSEEEGNLPAIPVTGGVADMCHIKVERFSALVDKGVKGQITKQVRLPEYLAAPIAAGEKIGTVAYYAGETQIGEADIVACEEVAKISFGELFLRMLSVCFGVNL